MADLVDADDMQRPAELPRRRAYSAAAALDIEFTSGAKYRYFAVPTQVFHEFLSADSKGVLFNRRIRSSYPCTNLDE